jgi:hypothetical protein
MKADLDLRDCPVFICGHPKSGTSLVRSILDSHPQLVVYPEETIFFRHFLPNAEGLSLQQQLELADRCLIHIFNWNQDEPTPSQTGFPDRDYSSIPYEAVRSQMKGLVESNYRHAGDILSAAILAFGQVSRQLGDSTRYWVEKSPYNEYYAKKIYGWWPEARCIHVLRDPRDNFASYRLKHPEWNAEFFSSNWNCSTKAGLQNRELYGDSHYLIIRFEDLVQSPEENLKKLTEFLGIQWNSSLTRPTRFGEQWKGNSMFTDRFQGISTTPVSRWKENLSLPEAATIELIAKYHMSLFKYPRHTLKSMRFFKAVEVRYRVGTWPIRRLLSRFQHGDSRSIQNHDQVDKHTDDELLSE